MKQKKPLRGRPEKSPIRQNIVEILYYLEKGYGYQIAKIYNEIFPQVTQRSIYYHLHKGILTKEIEMDQIEEEKGDFSWGQMVEKTYYALGKKAQPNGEERVKNYLQNSLPNQKWKEPASKKPVLPNRFTRFVERFRRVK